MLLFLFLASQTQALNLYCGNTACSNCTDGKLNYLSTSCLDVCPNGFSPELLNNNSVCNDTLMNKKLISLNFIYYLNFYSTNIEGFSHPNKFKFKDDQDGPIPTKDRGFFFTQSSRLTTSNSWVLAPNFKIKLITRVISPGVIFTITRGMEIIYQIKAGETSIDQYFRSCDSTSCTLLQFISNRTSEWTTTFCYTYQNPGYFDVKDIGNTSVLLGEFRPSYSDLAFSFGGPGTGFKGFLVSFLMSNDIEEDENSNYYLNVCNETQYYYNESCYECPSNSLWPLCSFSTGKACYSSNCTFCTGFTYLECDNCVNPSTYACILGKNCMKGEKFNCIECESGFVPSGNLCIIEIVPNISNQIAISMDFSKFLSDQLYFTWDQSNPKFNQPVIMSSRGFYFNGNTFLKSEQRLAFNYCFTISFWVLSMNEVPFFNSSTISIQRNVFMKIKLSNKEESRIEITRKSYSLSFDWTAVAFSVNFDGDTTNITQYFNSKLESVYTLSGYAYYNELSDVYLGCTAIEKYCFQGFIYTMDFWQYSFDFTDIHMAVVCFNGTFDCLSPCKYTQYYNPIEKACLDCNSTCNFGCYNWASCNKCNQVNCTECALHYNGTCNSEVVDANTCFDGLVYTSDTCCDSTCLNCYGPFFFKCLSCSSPFLFYNYMCVPACPQGYVNISNSCYPINNYFILSLSFENITTPTYNSTSTSFVYFGSNNSPIPGNFSDHPIPVGYRGFYFNLTSFVTCPDFELPVSNTIMFWIWVEEDGLIFSKNSYSLFSNGTVSFSHRQFLHEVKIYSNKMPMNIKKNWVFYALVISLNYAGTLTLNFYQNLVLTPYSIYNNAYYDTSSKTILGFNNFDSFKGFLYSFRIWSISLKAANITVNYGQGLSLNKWNCTIGEFFNGTSCQVCDSSCLTCVRTGDCNICDNMMCLNCTSYKSLCTECYNTTSENPPGTCYCPDFTFWNQSLASCKGCPNLCKNCRDQNLCLNCTYNATLTNGTCQCNSMFYNESITHCKKCDFTCLECNSSGKYNCTDCFINAHLSSDGECLCNDGFNRTDTGFECTACYKTCKSCFGLSQNNCISCMSNLNLTTENKCECLNRTYLDESTFHCTPCEESCSECTGPTYYSCSECFENFKKLSGYCISPCPLGYLTKNNECIKNPQLSPYVKFNFQEISGKFTDEVSKVIAITGNSPKSYLNLDEKDPIPVFGRGIYFKGNESFLSFSSLSKQILFGPEFCISFWVYPEVFDSVFLTHFSNDSLNFNVSIEGLMIRTDFSIFNEDFSYKGGSRLMKNSWNHVLIVLTYDVMSQIYVKINKVNSSPKLVTVNPFKDFLDSLVYVGSPKNDIDGFMGFLYSLELYIHEPDASEIYYHLECKDCAVCLVDGNCIPPCNLTSYHDLSICKNCSDECTSGCRSSVSCSLCEDPYCKNCSSYEKSSCFQCIPGYELFNKTCIKCENERFYDNEKKLCVPCQGLCKTCSSLTFCLSCIENSYLTDSNQCLCSLGYIESEGCIRKRFSPLISLNFQNEALITFSEELAKPMKKEDISIFIGKNEIDFEFHQQKVSEYLIVPKITSEEIKGVKLLVVFNKLLVSKKNCLLLDKNLTINLYGNDINPLTEKIKQAKNMAGVAATAAIGASIGGSAMMSDPTYFFNFLTSIEIYSYAALFNLEFDSSMGEFLNSVQMKSKVPNVFEYFIEDETAVEMDQKFKDFGYERNLILINSGVTFTVVSIIIVTWPLVYFTPLPNNQWIQRKIVNLKESYKFRVFLRIFIQSIFEISQNSVLGLMNSKRKTVLQTVDFCICATCLTIQLILTCALIKLIKKRHILKNEEEEEFFKRFGTFFSEFHEKPDQTLYYLLFVLRRFTIVALIFFISPGIVQITISGIFSLAVIKRQAIFYIISTQPFQDKIIQVYTVLNEILTLIFYVFLMLPFVSDLKISIKEQTVDCIMIILGAMMLNICFAIILAGNKTISWIKSRRKTIHLETKAADESKIEKTDNVFEMRNI